MSLHITTFVVEKLGFLPLRVILVIGVCEYICMYTTYVQVLEIRRECQIQESRIYRCWWAAQSAAGFLTSESFLGAPNFPFN